jgi:hypothetical protein
MRSSTNFSCLTSRVGIAGRCPDCLAQDLQLHPEGALSGGASGKRCRSTKTQPVVPKFIATSVYRIFRRWTAEGRRDAVLLGSVCKLNEDQFLDTSVIHGDDTLTHRREWTKPRFGFKAPH